MKRLLKYLTFFFVALVVLLAGALLVAETRWGKDRLRDLLVDAAGESLTADIRIGRIEGDLFHSIVVRDVLLSSHGDTLVSVPSLEVRYHPVGLLGRKIQIESVVIESPTVQGRQLPDSTWDLAGLLRPSEKPSATSSGPLGGWEVSVGELVLRSGRVLLSPLGERPELPRLIEKLELHAAFAASDTIQSAHLTSLAFSTGGPSLRVERIAGEATLTPGSLEVAGFELRTAQNSLQVDGAYSLGKSGRSRLDLRTSPLVAQEFSAFVPGIALGARPAVALHAEMENGLLTFAVDLREDVQRVQAEGRIDAGKTIPDYSAEVILEHVDIAPWLNKRSRLTDVSGRVRLQGSGSNARNADVQVAARLDRSTVMTYAIDRATVLGRYRPDSLTVEIDIAAPYGNAIVSAAAGGRAGRRRASASARLSGFDLGPLKLAPGLESMLNLEVRCDASDLDAEVPRVKFEASAAPSRFRDVRIDTLFTAGGVEGRALRIDTLLLASDQADIRGGGSLDAEGEGVFRFRAHVKDARPLRPIIGFDALSGDLAGVVSGRSDSLELRATLGLDTLSFVGVGAPSAEGDILVRVVHGSANVTADLDLQKPSYAPLVLDSARTHIEYRDGPVDVEATLFVREDVVGKVKTHVESDSMLSLSFPLVELLLRGRSWSNGQDTARVVVDRQGITVEGISLRHGEGELRASGLLAPDSGSDFRASLRNFELGSIGRTGDSAGILRGLAGVGMVFHGGTSRPAIAGKVNIQGLKYRGFTVGDIDGGVMYTDSSIRWEMDCVLASGDTTEFEGLVPLGGETSRSGPALERTGLLRLKSSRLDISPLRAFVPMADTLKGLLSGELTITQSAGRRNFAGRIRLDSGEVRNAGFGIAYDSISAVVEGRGDSLCLTGMVVRSTELGHLTATGSLVFPRGVSTLDAAEFHGNVFARDFVVSKTRDHELKTEGDLVIDRKSDSTSVHGSLDIERCRVWLPAFLEQSRSAPSEASLPLLVAATQPRDTLREAIPALAAEDTARAVGGGVGGRVRVNIPRNTWLQSPEINVEISGTLDLVPRRNSVEVFGYVNVERGSFTMYGKKFTFVAGRVDFQGGPTVDPNLVLEVKYSYRGPEKNQEEIRLEITGRASKPTLEFKKNGERITNANAVSYVMFGRSLDELSQDQKSTIAGSTNDLAQGLASSVLSNQLSNTVGKSLGLDVIEVSLQDNWRAAYLTAGKYISERVYVRYTKGFQAEESGEAMEEVALEYEPFRPFLLQLIQGTSKNTGLNIFIILK